MFEIQPAHNGEVSSIDLLQSINDLRESSGEPIIRQNVFHGRIADELEGDHYKTFVVQNSNKTESKYFMLTFDQVKLVAMRESKAVRRKILERINQLEQANQIKVPQTLPEALRLAADLADKVQEQQLLIEQQQPAVEFLGRYVEAKNTKGLREVAKVLGAKDKEFFAWLQESQYLYKSGGTLLPYAHYQHSGYFEVKTGESNGHAFTQTKFTPEGIAFIAKQWARRN